MSIQDHVSGQPALDAATARRRAALDAYSREVVFLLTPDGETVASSRAGLGLLGYGPGDRRRRRIVEMIHPDDLSLVLGAFQRCQRPPHDEETMTPRAHRADGSWCLLRVTLRRTTSESDPALGEGVVVRATLLDEVEPAAPTVGTLAVLGDLPIGVVVGNQRHRAVWANRAAEATLRWTVDDDDEIRWLHHFDQAGIIAVDEAIDAVLDGRSARRQVEVEDDAGRLLNVSVVPTRDEGSWIATVEDVTGVRSVERLLAESEHLRRSTGSAMSEGIVIHAPDGSVLRTEGPAAELMGLSQDELLAQTTAADGYRMIRTDGTHVERQDLPVHVTRRTGRPQRSVILGVVRPDRRYRWLSVSTTPLAMHDGTGVIVTLHDTTDQVEAEIFGQRLFELSVDMLLVFGPDGRITRANDAYLDFVGLDAIELRTHELKDFIHPDDLDATRTMIRASFGGARIKGFEARHRTRHGDWRWLSWHATHDQLTGNLYCVARDITDHKARSEELTKLALQDPLTGLANRNVLGEAIPRAIAQVRRQPDDPLALLYIDLDGFKRVNDDAGHAMGDLVLQVVAERLLETCRAADLIARIGGDEFVVVAHGTDQVEALADRIVATLGQPFPMGSYSAEIGATIGIAKIRPVDTMDSILARADGVLYEAKRAGGHRWRTAD